MADFEFYQQIILIIIPTISGAITSKWITSSWQSKKEKNELKRKILNEYDSHTPRTSTLIGIFIDRMIQKTNSPQEKFPKECEEFRDKYFELSYAANQFLRSLRLYYNEELENEFIKIVKEFGKTYRNCEKFMSSSKEEEIIDNKKLIDTELDQIKEMMRSFELTLVDTTLVIR